MPSATSAEAASWSVPSTSWPAQSQQQLVQVQYLLLPQQCFQLTNVVEQEPQYDQLPLAPPLTLL